MNTQQFVRVLCACLLLLVMTTQRSNAAIIYDEDNSGDLSNIATDPVLNFSSGTNTIRGNATITQSSSTSFDTDHFAFVIPGGVQLTNLHVC